MKIYRHVLLLCPKLLFYHSYFLSNVFYICFKMQHIVFQEKKRSFVSVKPSWWNPPSTVSACPSSVAMATVSRHARMTSGTPRKQQTTQSSTASVMTGMGVTLHPASSAVLFQLPPFVWWPFLQWEKCSCDTSVFTLSVCMSYHWLVS